MLILRNLEKIASEWCISKQLSKKVPSELHHYISHLNDDVYTTLVSKYGNYGIAGDFCLLSYQDIVIENKNRDYGVLREREDLFIFAVAGTGDAWLLDTDGNVFFLDHDHGEDAVPLDMHLNFSSWVQLADVMYQLEDKNFEVSSDEIKAILNTISPFLSERYPYNVFSS